MRRTSSFVVDFGGHFFASFVLLSLFIGTLGTEKKDIKHTATAPAASAAHVPESKHSAAASAAAHAHADSKHPSSAASPVGVAKHANPPPNGAHAPENHHPAAPVVKITEEANNIYSVCVERDVLPAPDNSPKDKLKAIAAKCDECGMAKCKAKCGGKEVNDACKTCITQNCPPAK